MLSRRSLLIGLATGLATAGPALAQDDPVTRGVIRQLETQGFDIVAQERTLLGRVRILARRGDVTRELVIDRRNGAILRDYAVRSGGASDVPDLAEVDDDEDDIGDDDGDDDDEGGDDGDDDEGDDESDDGGGDDEDDDG